MADINLGQLVWKVTGDNRALKESLKDSEENAKKSASTFEKLGGIIKKAFVVGAIYQFGKAMVKSAADMQQRQVAFTTMLGSAEKAKKLMKEVSDFAAKTPFELPELTEATKKLVAFGISSEEVIPTLQRIGDVASGLGIPLGELSEIYGKARVQGTLYAEDLNQLAGRGVPIFEELAKVTGRNAGEIKKLASEGKIGFGELEQVFKNMTSEGGMFFGGMEAQSKTFAGVFSTMSDSLDAAGRSIGEELLPGLTELFSAFSDSVNSGGVIVSVLGSVARAAGFVAESLATTVRVLDLMTIDQKQREFEGYQNASIEFTKKIKAEYGSLANLKAKANAGDKEAIKTYGAYLIMQADMAKKQKDMEGLSEAEEKLRRTLKGIKEEEVKIEEKKKDVLLKQKPIIKANAEEEKKAADERAAALSEMEELYKKKAESMIAATNEIGNAMISVLSAASQLTSALYQSRIDQLDAQMQKELEAAGAAEETTVEQAEREYAEAQKTGNLLDIEEKRRALVRAQILEKYEKKKRQLEYEAALAGWGFQLGSAIAAVPLAIMNALVSGWAAAALNPALAGWYPALLASLAGTAGGLQVAAISAAKPQPPKFATGGIVPGNSFAGDNVLARVNSGEVILNQEQQKRLLTGNAGQEMFRVSASRTTLWQEIFEAAENGNLFIPSRAVLA